MRIDAFSQVSQLYQATRPTKVNKTTKPGASDQVHISSAGHDYQTIKKALEKVPDVREDKVEPLKAKVASGTYSADIDSFAAKLFAKYEEMR